LKIVESAIQWSDTNLEKSRSPSGQVLVLGNDDRVVLALMRSLGRQKLQIHVAWCDSETPAMSSRYLHSYHELPPYSAHDDSWIIALNRLVESHAYDLIIPCNDFAVFPLQRFRNRLTDSGNWYLLDERSFQATFDKHRTSQLAKTLGIPTPRDILVGTSANPFQNDAAWITELSYPVYVKPRSSVTEKDVTNRRSAQRVKDGAELRNVLSTLQNPDGVLVQEGFDGEGHGVDILAFEGVILVEMQHRRLRETMHGGSTYRESTKLNPRLSKATAAMVAELGYTGVAMFEFRVDPQSDRYVLLEVNGRFWGSLPLAIVAGADFPFCLYQMLVCGRREFPEQYSEGVRCRNLVPDLRCIKKNLGTMATVWHLITIFFRGGHQDHWAWDDWKPQFRLFSDSIWSFVRYRRL
jgi:predicted ATP-grasp superfamily ATP-dependent carboligase